MTQIASVPTPQSPARRLGSGFGLSAAGTIGWRGLTAASSVIVARILGPAGFGELGIIRSTVDLFTTYAVFRLGTTANKHLAEFRTSDPPRAARILKLCLVMSGAFCAIAAAVLLIGGGHIARAYLANPDLGLTLRLGSVFLFFQAYSLVRETVLIGTEDFASFAKISLIKGLLTAVCTVAGALMWGVNGVVAGLGLASLCSYVVLEVYVRRALRRFAIVETIPFSVWKTEMPLLWTFALPGLLSGAITTAAYWSGRVVLAATDNGYAQLGLFEAANQWRTIILFLPGSLALIALPIISESFGRKDSDDFDKVAALQFNGILAISLPITVATILYSDLLMRLFGKAYAGSAPVLPLLMIAVFVFALNQSLRKIQDGAGHAWQNTFLSLIWAAAFAFCVLWLRGGFDAFGLGLAYLAAEAAMLIAQIVYVSIFLCRGFTGRTGTYVAIAAIALGAAFLASDLPALAPTLALVAISLVPIAALCFKESR